MTAATEPAPIPPVVKPTIDEPNAEIPRVPESAAMAALTPGLDLPPPPPHLHSSSLKNNHIPIDNQFQQNKLLESE